MACLNQAPIQQRIERSEDRALPPERAVDEPSFMGSRGQLAGCPQGPRADQHRRLPLAARLAKQRDIGVDRASGARDQLVEPLMVRPLEPAKPRGGALPHSKTRASPLPFGGEARGSHRRGLAPKALEPMEAEPAITTRRPLRRGPRAGASPGQIEARPRTAGCRAWARPESTARLVGARSPRLGPRDRSRGRAPFAARATRAWRVRQSPAPPSGRKKGSSKRGSASGGARRTMPIWQRMHTR